MRFCPPGLINKAKYPLCDTRKALLVAVQRLIIVRLQLRGRPHDVKRVTSLNLYKTILLQRRHDDFRLGGAKHAERQPRANPTWSGACLSAACAGASRHVRAEG